MPSEAWWCYERIYLCMVWHLYAYAWHYKNEMIHKAMQTYMSSLLLHVSLMSIIYWFLFLTYSVNYLYWRPFCPGCYVSCPQVPIDRSRALQVGYQLSGRYWYALFAPELLVWSVWFRRVLFGMRDSVPTFMKIMYS